MKTLANHVILFDEECPMCFTYTHAFITFKMLPENGRESYQKIPEYICPIVDQQRAVNEIALVNIENGEVTYGIHSIFKILANSMPIFKTLFGFGPFVYLMEKLYAFISYNRKVIIPAEIKEKSIQPTFKIHYRIAYLMFTCLVTAYILTVYANTLTNFVPIDGKYREFFICGGQILFQASIISVYKKESLWNYLGNMMTISFAGSLLLIPALLIGNEFSLQPIFYITYFFITAGLMFLEHLRRSKILKLGLLMSITWVIYRLIVLALILFF